MASNAGLVQQVNKASSDELLRKFAELGEDRSPRKIELRLVRRQKRCRIVCGDENGESPRSKNSGRLGERKCLLPRSNVRRPVKVLRHLGLIRAGDHVKTNKSFLRTIGKTWRRTVEGASKVFIERHYNRHKRLISDVA